MITGAVGQLLGQPVRFWFGREDIIKAIDQQYRHRQLIQVLPHIEVMDDGELREFVDKGPELYLTELFIYKVTWETGHSFRCHVS